MQTTDAHILENAARVIQSQWIGLLTTVAGGRPHARYMNVAITDGDPRRILTLSRPDAPKVADIRNNPNVCWVFASDEFDDVITIHGRARVVETDDINPALFDSHMADRNLCYLSPQSIILEAEKVVAIETVAQRIAWSRPHEQPPINEIHRCDDADDA